MSSWIGGSISSLTGQLSNLTKDILSEGTEEISDVGTELRLAKEKILEQDSVISTQRSEIGRVKAINKELEEKAESSELQINSISREYRSVLESKEKEVNSLKKQNSELVEQHARAAILSAGPSEESSLARPHRGHRDFGSDDFSPLGDFKLDSDDWHFDDNIRLQQEANLLRSNLQRTQAEVKHWKSVAGQLGQNEEDRSASLPATADVLDLQHKVKDLEAELVKKGDLLQQQAASLHDHHRQKLATLKEHHAKELKKLEDKVSSLESQLNDVGATPTSVPNTLPESDLQNAATRQSELEEKLAQAVKEKNKAQTARSHLEGVLEELQREVERLQFVEEQHQQRSEDADKWQKKIEELYKLLEKSESENKELKQDLEKVESDLVRNKYNLLDQLDANHADVQSVLGNLQEMREDFDTEAAYRRTDLRAEMRQFVNQLFHVGHKKNEASNALLSTKEKHDSVKADLSEIIDNLGNSALQKKTSELFDNLEKENITLKEQKLKLEEQVILLEKMSSASFAEAPMVCETSSSLSTGLPSSNDGDTKDESKTSDSSLSLPQSSHNALHISKEEVDKELLQLRQQYEELQKESSNYEMERADWMMEKEVLEDVLTDLRNQSQEQEEAIKQLKSLHSSGTPSESASSVQEDQDDEKQNIADLESEIKSLREENKELEKALEELDSQHSEALSQLIEQRNKMADDIQEKDILVKQYQSEIQSLNTSIGQLKESLSAMEDKTEEKISAYEKELSELRGNDKTVTSLKNELSDLSQKLHKGGLVINDLHMDKQELQEELSKVKEEMHSTKIELKEVNQDKGKLKNEKKEMQAKIKDLEDQLMEMEEEVDKWQQVNEDRQVGLATQDNKEKEECLQLRTQIQDMEKERQILKEEFQHLIHENKPHSDLSLKLGDSPFKNIFEEEMKVRQKLEDDERIIEELRGHVEKLQARKNELKLQVLSLENDLTESNSIIELIKKEKSGIEENLMRQTSDLQHKIDLISKLEDEIADLRKNAPYDKGDKATVLASDLEAYKQELVKIQAQLSEYETQCKEKDSEIYSLKAQVINFESVATHEIPQEKSDLSGHSKKQISLLQQEIEKLKEEKEKVQSFTKMIPLLESELSEAKKEVNDLKNELSKAYASIACNEAGISDLNEKSHDLGQTLAKAEVENTRQASTIAVLRQNSMERENFVSELQSKLNFIVTILSQDQMEKLNNLPNAYQANNAIEYQEMKAIEYSGIEKQQYTPVQLTSSPPPTEEGSIIEEIDKNQEKVLEMEKQLEELQKRLSEKDTIVSELQRSNSSLLGLVEKGGGGEKKASDQASVYKLEAEVQGLRKEREQMVAVVSEKSRENSSLKLEIQHLMEVVSASQAAMTKLQQDNANLVHEKRQPSPPREDEEDDMRREALANMARLVRDRETEFEALKQKNETLLAVLQETKESEAAAHLGPLLKEKETLTEQIKVLTSEREQLIACITQKHSESLAYHNEAQRLATLLVETQEAAEKAKSEYAAVIPAFEDKSQALVTTQTELMECKQKLTELEIHYGELIQRSNTQSLFVTSSSDDFEAERERHRLKENELQSKITQQDTKIESLAQKVSTLEETVSGKEAECMHVRKQLDNSKFQLSSLMSEIADIKTEKEQIQQRHSSQDEESSTLRDTINQMTVDIKNKELQIASLKDRIESLNSLMRDQEGDQSQLAQVMRERDTAMARARQLEQESQSSVVQVEQRLQECNSLKHQISEMRGKEQRQGREVERLRSHLIEMEEGYTKEALESEEREKELRNRLAIAEEQLLSSTSQVHLASQESHRQIEALQDQLKQAASQRDSAYIQITGLQEQCQQYSSSLSNLQLVLEHFQKEKDSAIAIETEKYQKQAKTLQTTVGKLQSELEATRADLVETLDGLEAASRISEQLDKKEEALMALKEEVQLREEALKTAEEEIRSLKSNTEAKVDKTLMHNMMMTWLTSPEKKRQEIVQLIGHVLDFSPDDFNKIEAAHDQGGLLIGFFKRTSKPSSQATPQVSSSSQSFSQLFVKFLERESSPPPTPVRLPAEAMVAETQHKHKTTFNPFMAPRHVTHEGSGPRVASQGSSHLLMSHDALAPSPLFAPMNSSSGPGESAILKDVLSNQR